MAFDRELLATKLKSLASQAVYLGTSSWKYDGWCDLIYDRSRYVYRGRYAESRFNRNCLCEYAEVFPTVCVDGAYYKFPAEKELSELAAQVPNTFRFGFKVTDEITIKHFPNLPRHGMRAGKANENFLNADLFTSQFLGPCEHIRQKIGLLMFEFSKFYPADFERGRDFVGELDNFLGRLPKDWPYGVELRNSSFLHPEYLSVLRKHGVAHVFNSWTEMPPVVEQLTLAEEQTISDLSAARFLLAPGRKYQEAVDKFSPYSELKELNEPGREAGAKIVKAALAKKPARGAYLFVNNRFEGNAPMTIAAILERAAL
jgi:uncharacterized protein YecE (DUF72 family)